MKCGGPGESTSRPGRELRDGDPTTSSRKSKEKDRVTAQASPANPWEEVTRSRSSLLGAAAAAAAEVAAALGAGGRCGGAAGVCVHLYDSAPSGTYGSMSYLVRATCSVLNTVPPEGNIDCGVM